MRLLYHYIKFLEKEIENLKNDFIGKKTMHFLLNYLYKLYQSIIITYIIAYLWKEIEYEGNVLFIISFVLI